MNIPVPKQYIPDFEQMGMGMFVHWGLYSKLNRGEWIFKRGEEMVSVNGNYKGAYAFSGVTDTVKSIRWMDNKGSFEFTQKGDLLAVNFTGQPYGISYAVRVAEADIL